MKMGCAILSLKMLIPKSNSAPLSVHWLLCGSRVPFGHRVECHGICAGRRWHGHGHGHLWLAAVAVAKPLNKFVAVAGIGLSDVEMVARTRSVR